MGPHTYVMTRDGVQNGHPHFSDMSKDSTVTLLFSSSGYGPEVIPQCEDVVRSSKYMTNPNGTVVMFINKVRIAQDARGDVTVTSGPKCIRASPGFGWMYVDTHFVQMAVEMNWAVKIRRGGHLVSASFAGFLVSNGLVEAGFDQYRKVFARRINPRSIPITWPGTRRNFPPRRRGNRFRPQTSPDKTSRFNNRSRRKDDEMEEKENVQG